MIISLEFAQMKFMCVKIWPNCNWPLY